jgi:guanylate kinase
MKFVSDYIVFSAPSGGGKTTLVNRLAKKYKELVISISATTRPQRPGEVNGKEYYFLSKEKFESAIDKGQFLEYEEVHGDYYGTLKENVDSLTKQGKTVLFDIDVNGAQSIKNKYPDALLIFIKPPSNEELIKRLTARKSETKEKIEKRLQRLKYEYEKAKIFDYIVINDKLDETIKEIEKIILK